MATEGTPILAITSFFTIAAGLIVLLIAYRQAKSKNLSNHKNLMLLAAGINAAFLVQYITRFLQGQETIFPGSEVIRNFVYLPILAVHILTAIITIVLVLTHLKRSLSNEETSSAGSPYFEKPYRETHRSFGRITFYFWITSFIGGITIFLMLYVIF
ncbi:MAG: DUF420 domain-containing protein [Candidatus Kariarchaeaceae archaeon]|jgi:putative membrane protein